MKKIKYLLFKFMQGRYGNDALNNFTLVFVFILLILNSLFFHSIFVTPVLFVMMVLTIYRTYSRNITARTNENVAFLKLVRPITHHFKVFKININDKENKTFICPKCKTNVRVPRNKGNITITCPKCRERFDKRT